MTMIMSPTRVLECQAELSSRINKDEIFQRFVYTVLSKQYSDGSSVWDRAEIHRQARMASTSLAQSLRAAEAYHVSVDMTKVVQAAAAGLDDTDQFQSSLAPSSAGIVRFDGGLQMTDVRGAQMRIDWIVWGTSVFGVQTVDFKGQEILSDSKEAGINWYEFNDAIDNPDEISQAMPTGHKVYGRWGFAGMSVATDNQRLGAPLVRAAPETRARLRFEGAEPIPATNTMRLLHAFFLLLQQEITVVSSQRPHPSVRPALKKARLPKTAAVTVVELRKHRYVSDGQGGTRRVEWDHRWLVRGFWRWQPYGPGRTQRRRIWINDFVKGPGNRPLVIKNRVSDLRR